MGAPGQFDPLPIPGAPPGGGAGPGRLARRALVAHTLPTLERVGRGPAAFALPSLEPTEEPPAAEPPLPAAPPPPTFDEAELAKAMAHARHEGALAAAAEVRAELTAAAEHRTSRAVEAIAVELARCQEGLERSLAARAGASRELALALARAILPRALADRPLADIEAMLIDLVGRLDGRLRLELAVAPDLVASAEALLGRIAADAGHAGELSLHADPALGPGDARLTWTDGVAERDLAALEREAVALVDAWLSPPCTAAIEPSPTLVDPGVTVEPTTLGDAPPPITGDAPATVALPQEAMP